MQKFFNIAIVFAILFLGMTVYNNPSYSKNLESTYKKAKEISFMGLKELERNGYIKDRNLLTPNGDTHYKVVDFFKTNGNYFDMTIKEATLLDCKRGDQLCVPIQGDYDKYYDKYYISYLVEFPNMVNRWVFTFYIVDWGDYGPKIHNVYIEGEDEYLEKEQDSEAKTKNNTQETFYNENKESKSEYNDKVLNTNERKEPVKLKDGDFSIVYNGKELNFSDEIEKISEVLGTGKVTDLGEPYEGAKTNYLYEKDGISISYYDFIECIYVEKRGYPTAKGLEVGDSYYRMIELYGEGAIYQGNDDCIVYYYTHQDPDAYKDFFVQVDKATNKVVSYNFATGL